MNISIILPYANPHVLDWVLKMDKVNLNIGCIHSTQKFRPGYFKEYDDIDQINYFFKLKDAQANFINDLKNADVLITLGIFDKYLLKLAKYCKPNLKLIVLSEPFNPINSKEKVLIRKLWSMLIRYYFKQIDFFCIGGFSVKEYYLKLGFKKATYYNFGYFPKIKITSPKYNINNEKITIGYLGQLIPRKGIDRVIGLMDKLSLSNFNFEFKIVGDGFLKEEIQEKIKILANENIKYLGLYNTKDKVEAFLEEVDILFVPSYFDGWGAVVNEGMAKNCVIVASDQVFAARSIFNKMPELTFKEDYFTIFQMLFKDDMLNQFKDKILNTATIWNADTAALEVQSVLTDVKNEVKILEKI